jgi:hypothetical protein
LPICTSIEVKRVLSQQPGEVRFAGATITNSFKAPICEKPHHSVSGPFTMNVEPRVLTNQFGPFANKIETDNTRDLKITWCFFGPCPKG